MEHTRRAVLAGAAAAGAGLLLGACGTADSGTSSSGGSSSGGLTPVKLQLQWFNQAQFAGYLAADEQGYYKDAGLDMTILEGGTDIVPQTVLAQRQADFAIAWVPKALASREQGAGITHIAQIFARSGTTQVSFKDKGITTATDFKGKKIGNWGFGNEFELFAGMTKAGLDPSKDVTLVQQQFDMNALLQGDIDAAQAMVYNEYAQVLEATNPATGSLYTPDDFNVIKWSDQGTSMLQDSIWANTEQLKSKDFQKTAIAFLAASIKGWVYARDNPEKTRDIVVARGSKLGKSHQLWQVNEVNKLIWPSTSGIGVLDPDDWKRTVTIAQGTKNAAGETVLTKAPDPDAETSTYLTRAIKQLKGDGVDVMGTSFAPQSVTLAAGGA